MIYSVEFKKIVKTTIYCIAAFTIELLQNTEEILIEHALQLAEIVERHR